MNYCSIEDAWKNSGYISDQYKKYDNNDVVETFEEPTIINNDINYAINDNRVPTIEKNNKIQYNKVVKKINNQNCMFTCDNLFDHINKCPKCRMRLRKQFSSKVVKKLQTIIFDNKDTVLLVLISLFIFIFFNLLFSIFRR
jgi:hypothetical protein